MSIEPIHEWTCPAGNTHRVVNNDQGDLELQIKTESGKWLTMAFGAYPAEIARLAIENKLSLIVEKRAKAFYEEVKEEFSQLLSFTKEGALLAAVIDVEEHRASERRKGESK